MPLVIRILSGPFGELSPSDVTALQSWIRHGQTLTVGRTGERADLAVHNDARMSGSHFQLFNDEHGCRVRDLDSCNGTMLNGEQITEAPLRHGDIIRAGQTTFGVSILEDESVGSGAIRQPSWMRRERMEKPVNCNRVPQADLHGSNDAPSAAVMPAPVSERVDPAEPIQAVLRIDRGPFDALEKVNLTHRLHWVSVGESLSVGRSPKADIAIGQDSSLSSLHFKVTCDERTCQLVDLGSRNGTFVNRIQVTSVELHNGDVILAGQTTIRVGILGGIGAPAPKPTGASASSDCDKPPSARAMKLPDVQATELGDAPASEVEPMQVVVTIAEGPWGEQNYQSLSRMVVWFGAGQTVMIGRDHHGTDLAITRDPNLSSQHFQLDCDGKQCCLRDLQSQHGTFVNGQRVSEAIIAHGDLIQAGGTKFRVAVHGMPQAPKPEN